jgi:hypothetical protein
MSVEVTAAVDVVAPELWLSLRIEPTAGELRGPPSATDVAGLLATIEALGRLSDVAVRNGTPVAQLVAAWTRSPPPGGAPPSMLNLSESVPRVIRPEGDLWWALRREFDIAEEGTDPRVTVGVRDDHDWRNADWRRPVRVRRLHFGSPLEIVTALPWEWFGPAGGGMVFLKVVEHWLHSPQRIRVDRARLREQAAAHRAGEAEARANEAEARKRELVALQDIERLTSINNLAQIDDGELRLETP